MRIHVKKIIAGLAVLLACFILPAAAQMSAPDTFVFDLVNQFRAAPYARALSLGYDPVFLQERGIGPETAFTPYIMDAELGQVAAAANARAQNPEADAGTIPPVRRYMAETGSMLTFSHFMPMETAGTFFVENLFKQELDTGQFQFILSNAFAYAGVSVDAGMAANQMNAWFFTMTIGSFERTSEDIQVLNLINQIRSEPVLLLSYMEPDFVQMIQQNPHIYHLPGLNFPPVFPNKLLHQWARTDAAQPVRTDEANGAPFFDIMAVYPGDFFRSATVGTFWEDPVTARPVMDLFFALMRQELSTWPFRAVVFSNRFNEAGTALSVQTQENSRSGILSLGVGSGERQMISETGIYLSRIYGIVFSDKDQDTLYSPGEGMAGHFVTVYDESGNTAETSVTDNAGHFSLALESGRHWVVTVQAGEQTVSRAIHTDRDLFLKLDVNPALSLP
jgi:hypothetical protein